MAQDQMAGNYAGPLAPIGGNVACENRTNISTVKTDVFSVPSAIKDRADKKKRLIELLHKSLYNDATAINDVRKREGSTIDAGLEKEIRKLAKEIGR